uniref:28S ribosomal protein S18a, mitochondrial n=1 Tax=Aceria tosichella TaxID=561515 RepID=A0A6G1S4L8_9ACAR
MFRYCASSLISTLSHHNHHHGQALSSTARSVIARLVSQGNNYSNTTSCRSTSSSSTGPISTSQPTLSDATYIEDNLKLNVKELATDETLIEAVPVDTGRAKNLVNINDTTTTSTACVLCRLNLRNLSYTDVMILSQFIKRNGSMVTYHESKLCTKQYRKVVELIKKAQRCNLIQRPPGYLVPGAWHDLNTYLEPDRKRDQPMKVVKKEYWKI